MIIGALACSQSANSPPDNSVAEKLVTDEAAPPKIVGSLSYPEQNEIRKTLTYHCGRTNHVVGERTEYPDGIRFSAKSPLLRGVAKNYVLAACLTTDNSRLVSMGDLRDACGAINRSLSHDLYENESALEEAARTIATEKLAEIHGVGKTNIYVFVTSSVSFELKR